MKNKILIILLTLSTIICSSQTKYYKDYNGKILNITEFTKLKKESLENYKKMSSDMVLIDETKEIHRNRDSVIYEIELIGMSKGMVKEMKVRKKLIGKKFPFENLTTIDGKKLNFVDLNGKPTLINFWFTQCYPCLEEIPVLNQIKEEFKDKINFISITYDSKEKVLKLFEKEKYDFIHLTDQKDMIKKMGIKSYPQNYLINKNGLIFSVEDGIEYLNVTDEKPKIGNGNELREKLKKLLTDNS
jgi:cytochrome c biogenesis protein CcmG/thiol:disulfide interchange protein DsbE